MRVFISADIEGISGVVHPVDTNLEGVEYEQARRWMTAETNAAIEGAFLGGADEVLVNDSHGHMRNLLADELDRRARLIRGNLKPYGMMQGIEPGTAAAFLVGYHAKAGTQAGILAHTFIGSMIYNLRINDLDVGETGFNAALAGAMGIPVVLVSGDEALSQEVEAILPWSERVVVKKGITSWTAENISPWIARERIRESAERAIRRLNEMQPMRVAAPVRLEVTLLRPIYADLASLIPGVERTNGTTVVYEGSDMLAVNRAWMAIKHIITSKAGNA